MALIHFAKRVAKLYINEVKDRVKDRANMIMRKPNSGKSTFQRDKELIQQTIKVFKEEFGHGGRESC